MKPDAAAKMKQQMQARSENASVVETRLDPSDLKQSIRYYLEGRYETVEENQAGEQVRVTKQSEEMRKMTQEGIHSVMSIISSTIDPAVVQGNTSEKQYKAIIGDFQANLRRDLWVNAASYGLTDKTFETVVEQIVHTTRLFLSRTIGDGEREALSNSITVSENRTVNSDSSGFMSRFFGG